MQQSIPPLTGSRRSAPLLVTGVPRSGTTWVARQLAGAPGTALAGREPMNPRGRQYALGGTVSGWVRLAEPTARQRLLLRAAYRGLNPLIYSRYGHRQWRAPLPWTRLVVKDPFAMLSMPAIARLTGARPVLVYRHPGAVLSSYRRMGWSADLGEVRPLARDVVGGTEPLRAQDVDEVAAMAHFWALLHRIALQDLSELPDALVVSHEELATGGDTTLRALFSACGLTWAAPTPGPEAPAARTASEDPAALHNFERPPAEVAGAWRSRVTPEELATLSEVADPVLAALDSRRLLLQPA